MVTPGAEPEPEPEDIDDEEDEWKPDSITYKITGSADRVDLTLFNDEGGIEQHSNVRVPHEYEYEEFRYWFASVSAQNAGESGSVTVAIYLNGKKAKSCSSSGAYVIASADLSLD